MITTLDVLFDYGSEVQRRRLIRIFRNLAVLRVARIKIALFGNFERTRGVSLESMGMVAPPRRQKILKNLLENEKSLRAANMRPMRIQRILLI